MIDSKNINDLHPTVARAAYELIERMKKIGYPVGISSTYRDFEKQDALYAQGRTTAGSVVTNAKAGYSLHNYRLAFDIYKNVKGQEWSDSKFFEAAGKIGQEMGFKWGGSFTTLVDKPHFEYTGGLTLDELRVGKTLAQTTRMPWEKVNVNPEPIETTGTERESEIMYHTFEELPSWAKPTIKKLLDKGYLKGTGEDLGLSEDMVKGFVVNDRAGLYD